MNLKKTIIRNTSVGWIERTVSIIATIIVFPVLIKHFGRFEYGLWVTIGQGAALLMLLDFGIANSIARFVAKNYAKNDHDENIRVFSTAMVLFFLASLIVLVITAAVLPFIPDIFGIDDPYRGTASWLFAIIGLNIAVAFPLRVGRGLLQAIDRYDIISLCGLCLNLMNLILIVLIFGMGRGDLLLLALITLGLNLFMEGTLFRIAMKHNPYLRFDRSMITKHNFRELTSLGSSSLVLTASGLLYGNGIIIIISIILGISATPLFSIPNSMLFRLGPFIGRLGSTFMPIASRMDAIDENDKLQNLNMMGVRYGLAISLPIGVFLLFYGRELLMLWLGNSGLVENDINIMSTILIIMLIPFALGSPQMASRSILRATGKHWIVTNWFLISALIGFITAALIMLYTDLGILGAAIGVATRFILADILLLPFLICRHLKVRIWQYVRRVYLVPLICAIALSAFTFCLKYFFPASNIMSFIIAAAIYAVASLLLVFRFILLAEHRAYLFNLIKQRILVS